MATHCNKLVLKDLLQHSHKLHATLTVVVKKQNQQYSMYSVDRQSIAL